MAFENLTVEHGALGNKVANITNIPEAIVKLVDQAWRHSQEHPDQYHSVTLANAAERDEFHRFAKGAAKLHEPVLDYRKLPRPGASDKVAFFTIRELTPDTPRPGRKVTKSEPKA